jgi:hypothetical protein
MAKSQLELSFILEADQGALGDSFFQLVLDSFIANLNSLESIGAAHEVIVVTDDVLPSNERAELTRMFAQGSPFSQPLRFHVASTEGYWSKKQQGAQVAFGESIIFIDSDCVSQPGWAVAMVGRIREGAEIVRGRTFGYDATRNQLLMSSIWQFPVQVASDPLSNLQHSWGNNFAVSAELLRAHPIPKLIPNRPNSRIPGHYWDSPEHPITTRKVSEDAWVKHLPYETLTDYAARMRLHGREMQQISVLVGAGIKTLLRKVPVTFAQDQGRRLSAVAEELGISEKELAKYRRFIRVSHFAMMLGRLEGILFDRKIRAVPVTETDRSLEQLGVKNTLLIQNDELKRLRLRKRRDIAKLVPLFYGKLSIRKALRQNARKIASSTLEDSRQVSDLGISVIIATKNRLALLCRALNSLSAQTVFANEVVVINDGNAFDEFAKNQVRAALDSRVKLVIIESGGIGAAAARQRGIEKSTQPVICYLDDDNLMFVSWIESITEAFKVAGTDVVYGAQTRPDFKLGFLGTNFVLNDLKRYNFMDTGTFAHRRELGDWDSNMQRLNDWDFALTLALKDKANIRYVPRFASTYLIDATERISDHPTNKAEYESAIRKKHGL